MKRLQAITAAAVLSVIGVTAPASARVLTFETIVDSSQEITSPTNRGAIGAASITVDTVAMNIDFGLRVLGLNLSDLGGLPQPVLDTAGPVHLHIGNPTETGPIAVAFGPTTGANFSDSFPFAAAAIGLVPGFSLQATDVAFGSSDEFDGFLNLLSTGHIYLNVHTFLNPAGEIRGNFAGLDPISAVPLPASALFLMAGFGGLAALRRKKA